MPNTNRPTTQAHDAILILGIQKYLLNVATLTLAGTSMTPAQLIQRVQARIDSGNAIAAARAKWQDLVQADRVLNQELAPTLRGLRQYLLNTYGEAKAPLADFGMSPPKKATTSPKTRVVAAQKAIATRAARHTAGKIQKKQVKGTVAAIVTAPALSGSAPATPGPAATALSQGTSGGTPHAG